MPADTIVMAEGRRLMRLSRELAPERFEALLGEFQTLLRGVFDEAGGRDVAVSGDTVTAVFSTAHEAALAALAAQRAVADHAWPAGPTVAMSVGVAADESGCADLCDSAEAGQVFLSPATARALEGDLETRDLGVLRTRRTGRPVEAHELVFA